MTHRHIDDGHSVPLASSPPTPPPLPPPARRSMHTKSKSCAGSEQPQPHAPDRRQLKPDTIISGSPLVFNSSRSLSNQKDEVPEEDNPSTIRGQGYPHQEGLTGLGIQPGSGSETGTETATETGTGSSRTPDGDHLLRPEPLLRRPQPRPRPILPSGPLSRPRSMSHPEAFPPLSVYWATEFTEGRRPDLGVYIGDGYTTITFRRARNYPHAFDIEAWHPDFDNPNHDRFHCRRRRSSEDAGAAAVPAAEQSAPSSSSPSSSEEAIYTIRGVPRSRSTPRHDNGSGSLRDPMSQPHLNGHRQRSSQQIAANKDIFDDKKDSKHDDDWTQNVDVDDISGKRPLNYRRRTTAFDDNALQFRRQGNIFTDADIESILRAGASPFQVQTHASHTPPQSPSSASSPSRVFTAGFVSRQTSAEMRNHSDDENWSSETNSRGRDGQNRQQSQHHDQHHQEKQSEKYVYRSRHKSVEYSKRHRSLSRERRELDKSTMRYEPVSSALGNHSQLRSDLESFPVIVIPERGLSLQENRQKSHEQQALHEEFMNGQIRSSLDRDLNNRRVTHPAIAAGTPGQAARRRNTTDDVKPHEPLVVRDQPRPSKPILSPSLSANCIALNVATNAQFSDRGGIHPQSSTLTSPGNGSFKPIKPQWVDEADRGQAMRNRVAVARRNTLRRLKSKMTDHTASSIEDYHELPSPISPPNPTSPNIMGLRAFNTASSDELDSTEEEGAATSPRSTKRPHIGRVPSSKPHVTTKKMKRQSRSRSLSRSHSRSQSKDTVCGVSNRQRSVSPAVPRRSSSIGRTYVRNSSCSRAPAHRRDPSTPQSSRSASIVPGVGRDRSSSFPLRGRAPPGQQLPQQSQSDAQDGKSERPLPPLPLHDGDDNDDIHHPLPNAHHQDRKADTDYRSHREVCLDQAANDEFQRIIQGQVTLNARAQSLRQLHTEEAFKTPPEQPDSPKLEDNSVKNRLPPSAWETRVERGRARGIGEASPRPTSRVRKGRTRPILHINTQVNGSFIASSITSNSADNFFIAPTLQSWANKSQTSWVEIGDARAVTIANHHISSVHRIPQVDPPSAQSQEKHKDENGGSREFLSVKERARRFLELHSIPPAPEVVKYNDQDHDDGGDDEKKHRRRSEVHWLDDKPIAETAQETSSSKLRRSHTTKERGARRTHDEALNPPRHSIQIDSPHRRSFGSAAEAAERDVGSPLEYLRRSLRRDSRRMSTGNSDASSIARHIQQTQRRLEGQPSPPGEPRTYVPYPRNMKVRTIRAAQAAEEPKENLWKRMGRKMLRLGKQNHQETTKPEQSDNEVPARTRSRDRASSTFGDLVRRASNRMSRRDKAEQTAAPGQAPKPTLKSQPGVQAQAHAYAQARGAATSECEERERRYERQPRGYRQRLQRSLSRASRKLRRKNHE